MSRVAYNPEEGEWISAATVQRLEELVAANEDDYAAVFNGFPDLRRPTAAEVKSPHSQACVEEQRRDLCAWVVGAARARQAGVPGPDFGRAEFRCACVAGGLLLQGTVGPELAGGRHEVGWVKVARRGGVNGLCGDT